MIQIRELEFDESFKTRRACSGCGKNARVQIVGQTVIRDTPSSESVDLCKTCGGKVVDALLRLRRKGTVKGVAKRRLR